MLVPRQGTPESIIKAALKGQRDAERRFGKKKPHGEYEGRLALGFLSGKVSAIRWVLGYEWDMLDS
jgi:hypothetical protein